MIIARLKASQKRLKQLERNEHGEKYKTWRKDVLNRDDHICQYPKCGSTKELQIHHIKKWAKYRHLRYNVSNGITLCKECHQQKVNGREHRFEFLFLKMVFAKNKQHKLTCREETCNICKRMGHKAAAPAAPINQLEKKSKKKRGRPPKSPAPKLSDEGPIQL